MAIRLRAAEHRAATAILGVGAYRGSRVVNNAEIAENLDLPEKWIVARSGIRSRRWAIETETLAAMSAAAAKNALAHAAIASEDVGCVIVATITHLQQTPAVAPVVAAEIGAVNAGAFDLSAACAGFCYALALASDTVRSGGSRYVLVIGAERISDMLDLDDSSTSFLFADGAGAVVVGPSDEVAIGPVVWGADGTRKDVIRQAAPWDRLRSDPAGPWPGRLEMSGTAVYRWAIQEMAPVARHALELAGVGVEDLSAFIPHQANGRIVTAVSTALNLPEHVQVAFDVAEQGNTSAASIPLAMSRLLAEGEVEPRGLALLVGFGAGLAHAAQVVRLPEGAA
ncbi:beta-ketoacyl-ACP synthase 3 [Streptomyces sp. NPDC051172]|uniref:beta-ketoacyl-ACP synthase 3 n=1 Tax=Streptomyces sp. NPDC051172 TaxID=3155796 RepID=UPI003426DA0A